MPVDLSVVIPTYRRPDKLAACLRALAGQTLAPDRFEVLVGVDGPDPEGAEAARRAWREAGGRGATLVLTECPRSGLNEVRNRVLAGARGRVLVSINDDVVPCPEFLAVHLREQEAARERGRPAVISGYSPWRRYPDDTLFDRLVRETSMVFFYDRMLPSLLTSSPPHLLTSSPPHALTLSPSHPLTPSPTHDWGFRHCWGLNFSAPLWAVREVGCFTAFPLLYGYDDIELAWKLRERFGMPVLFRPGASAEHDHRYGPREILDRERRLGIAAWHFAQVNAAFCREVFGRDIRGPEEVEYSRAFVAREKGTAERLEKSFLSLGEMPADAVGGDHAPALINLVYEQHLLLKRWWWRSGLLDASAGD